MKTLLFTISIFLFFYLNDFAQEAKLMIPVGHTDKVNSATFSPDGKKVITASSDHTAKIWDANTGVLLAVLNANKDDVRAASFSNDGKIVKTISWGSVAAGSGYSVKIWNAYTGILLREIKGHTKQINSVSVSADGLKTIAAPDDHSLKICDAKTGESLVTLNDDTGYLWGSFFSLDGSKVVTTYANNTAKVWDIKSGIYQVELTGHTGGVRNASFSPDGKSIVTSSLDKTAKIWDVQTGKMLVELKGHSNWVMNAIFSPDGNQIATSSRDNSVKIWDSHNGSLLADLKLQSINTKNSPFSLDSKKIVTTTWDHTIKIWNARTGLLLAAFKGDGEINDESISFSPDGKKIISISNNNAIQIWDAQTGAFIRDLKGHSNRVNSVSCSPDSKIIAALSQSDFNNVTLKTWAFKKGLLLKNLKDTGKNAQIPGLFYVSPDFSTDGKKIAIGFSKKTLIFNVETGAIFANIRRNSFNSSLSNFSPDGKKYFNLLDNGTAEIWDIEKGSKLAEINGTNDLSNNCFSPDSKRIIRTYFEGFGVSYGVRLFDAETGLLIAKLNGLGGRELEKSFSPDGTKILTKDSDQTAKIWDTQTGALLTTLKGHNATILDAKFSADGKKIVTVSDDGNLKIWDVEAGEVLLGFTGDEKIVNSANFSPDGKKIITIANDSIAKIWDAQSGLYLARLKGFTDEDSDVIFIADGKNLVNTSTFFSTTPKLWDSKTGELLASLRSPEDKIKTGCYSSDFKYMFTVSPENVTTVWDTYTFKKLYTFLAVDSTDYLVTDPYGRYDGTEGARKLLYFTCGTEVIGLDQVKDQLWVPNLAERIMKGDSINAKKLSDLDICGLIPQVEKEERSGYHFMITPQRGGLGETVLFVNDIEVKRYKPSQLLKIGTGYELNITDQELQPYFIAGQENSVLVKAYTAKNDISSRGAKSIQEETKKPAVAPNLYAVMIGISDYKGPELQLKYAAKDATDISDAVKASAGKLLGKEHIFTYNLTTGSNHYQLPEKIAIKSVLGEIGKKATANDILLIFFAGHGVISGEKKQFYFLTADASQASATDAPDQVGISTAELSDWMKPANIKAQKRILILDACNSGQAINELVKVGNSDQNYLAARNDDKAELIKAIDKLNEKSGLFILAASASNQSAYEMGRYSQGLLTYSLLKAIKQDPNILEDSKYLNVSRWFNAAEKTVSDIVRETGNRQEPQIVSAGNFNIGLVDQDVMAGIKLAEEKPLFTASNLQNNDPDISADDLHLNSLLDNQLSEISTRGDSGNISYIPGSKSPDAYSIGGRYIVNGEDLTVKVNIRQNDTTKFKFELSGKKDDLKILAGQLVKKASDWILKNK